MNKRKGLPPSLLDVSQFSDQGIRLLIVEDNEADFHLINHHLLQHGMKCTATQVQRLDELKQRLEHEEWHAVISDHSLLGFSAEEALRVVKNSGLDIPFLIVSGGINEHRAVQAMRAGADDYLLKNNLVRLVPAIERAMRTTQEHRSLLTAEFAHRELEKQLNTLTSNIEGMVIQILVGIHHEKPMIKVHGEGSTQLLGITPEQFLDKPDTFFQLFESEDTYTLSKRLKAKPAEKNLYWEGRLKTKTATHPRRWFALKATVTPQGHGYVWDGLLLDISEQKQTEEHLHNTKQEFLRINNALEKRREQERQTIAQEIHDDMGSSLVQLSTDIACLKTHLSDHPEHLQPLKDMQHLVSDLLRCSQRIAQNLRPSVLDLGLVAAMQWQVNNFQQRTHIQADFSSNRDEIHLETAEKTTLFRILQEALTNIVKHAQATQVEVELFENEENISLEIRDNGKGMQSTDKLKQSSFGLLGMQERVNTLQGWIEIHGVAGHGTTVMVVLPKTSPLGHEAKHD